jgi:hypothetical protein
MNPTKHIILTAAFALSVNLTASAATLSSGSATINYIKSAWDNLASGFAAGPNILTLDSYFDQAATNARTSAQIQSDPAIPGSSYTGEIYAMNGASVINLSGRTTQATTFDFTPGNPQGGTGVIGLGGIARFSVSPLVGGGALLYGDYTLQYDATRIGGLYGGTGWYLKGNIPPAAATFDILNVNVVETPSTLTVSGDLGVTYEVANLLYNTPTDQGANVGSFTFTAQVVPEPSACVLMLTAVASFAGFSRRRSPMR